MLLIRPKYTWFAHAYNRLITPVNWLRLDAAIDLAACFKDEGRHPNDSYERGTYAAILELRERAKSKFGDTLEDDWYLFFSDYGDVNPHRPVGHWRRAWKSVLKEAGVAKCRFYDSRHTVVTELLQDPTVSEETAKSIVGHVSRKMLERYSHQRMEPKRSALEAPTFGTQGLPVIQSQPAEAARKN